MNSLIVTPLWGSPLVWVRHSTLPTIKTFQGHRGGHGWEPSTWEHDTRPPATLARPRPALHLTASMTTVTPPLRRPPAAGPPHAFPPLRRRQAAAAAPLGPLGPAGLAEVPVGA